MVSTTRPISCLTLRSRSGVPICPRKYLETTMLVACCDQKRGISTSRCSNTTSPRSLPMSAARRSHSTSSNGSTPASVKKRGNARPGTDADAFLDRPSEASGRAKPGTDRRPTALHRSAGQPLRPDRQRSLSSSHSVHSGLIAGSQIAFPPLGMQPSSLCWITLRGLTRFRLRNQAISREAGRFSRLALVVLTADQYEPTVRRMSSV